MTGFFGDSKPKKTDEQKFQDWKHKRLIHSGKNLTVFRFGGTINEDEYLLIDELMGRYNLTLQGSHYDANWHVTMYFSGVVVE